MAVVLSSVALAADDTDGRRRVLQSSPYSVMETVHRLEAAAQRHGLPVFARVAQRAGPLASAPAEAQVLVLASSIGGTPVLMSASHSPAEVPMSMVVRPGHEGGADVLFDPRLIDGGWPELPLQALRELADLPAVVAEALAVQA